MSIAPRVLAFSLSFLVAVEPVLAETGHYFRQVQSKGQMRDAVAEQPEANPNAPSGTLRIVAPTEVRARPGVPFDMALDVSGAKGALEWTVSKGALPAGLSITADGHVTGTPSVPGRSEGIRISAKDTAGSSGSSGAFAIDVRPVPAVTLTAPAPLKAGEGLDIAPAASGTYGSTLWRIASGTLPVGTGINAATGRITGNPEQKGIFEDIVVSVTDLDGATGYSAPFTVSVDSHLSIAGLAGAYPMRAGRPFSPIRPYLLGAEGSVSWSYSRSSVPAPSWLRLNAATGELTGTPAAPETVDGIVLRATDSGSGSSLSSAPIRMTVSPAPSVEFQESYTLRSGSSASDTVPFTIKPKVAGLIGEPRPFAVGVIPEWLRLDASGQFVGSVGNVVGTFPNLRMRLIDVFDGAQVFSNPFSVELLPAFRMARQPDRVVEKSWPAAIEAPVLTNLLGTVSWEIRGAPLPAGLAFDTATGRISGTPEVIGPPTFHTVVATDSRDGAKATTPSFSLAVVEETPFELIPSAPATGRVGRALSVRVGVQGSRGTLSWTADGSLPDWASLDPATGVVSGTPPEKGPFGPFTLSATDSVLGTTVSSNAITGTVLPAHDISIALGPIPPAEQGKPFAFRPEIKDPAGPVTVSLAGKPLPDGLSLDPATGRISGTPRTAGLFFDIALRAQDGNATATSPSFTIQVAAGFGPDGKPYAATMTREIGGAPGDQISASPTVTGFEGPLSWSVHEGSLPAWATLDPATGRISGKAGGIGAWPSLSLKVVDAEGIGVVSNAFGITVAENRVLSADMTALLSFESGQYKEAIPTVRNAVGQQSWTLAGRLPSGLSLDKATGKISGTTNEAGSFPNLVLEVTDSTGTADRTDPFSITVSRGALSARPAALSFDAAYGLQFTAPAPTLNGVVGTPAWSIADGSALPSWALLDPATGAVSGKPSAPADIGKSVGIVLAVATATQDAATSPAFDITVPRPTLSAGAYAPAITGRVGSQLVAKPKSSGLVGQAAWSLEGQLPAGLSLVKETGAIEGVPSGPAKADKLVLVLRDSYDGKEARTEAFSVAAVLKPARLDVSGPGDVEALNGEDLATPAPTSTNSYGALSWSAKTALPDWLTLDPKTGVLSGKPAAVETVEGIVLSTKDADDVPGETAPFSIEVGPNLKLSGLKPAYSGPSRRPFATDAPQVANATGTVAYSLSGDLPGGLLLDPATGIVAGTPPEAATSTGLVLTATDARGDAVASAPFTIAVTGLAVSNVPAAQTAYAGVKFEGPVPAATGAQGALSWSLLEGTLPGWASLEGATGKISGTPAAIGRTSGLRLLATDAGGNVAKSPVFGITVDAKLAADTMPGSFPGLVGESLTISPPAPRDAVGAVAWTLTGSRPEWLSFDPGSGVLSGTPVEKGKVEGLSLKVSDATGKTVDLGAFSISVAPNVKVGDVPAAYPARIKVQFTSPRPSVANAVGAVAWSVEPAGSGATGAGAPESASPPPPALPSWASVAPSTGVISGTPVAGGGSGQLVLVAKDANGDVGRSQPFVIAVSNGLAVANIRSSVLGRVGNPLTVSPAATGSAGPFAWGLLSGNLPAWASLDPATGAITGTPTGAGTISGLVLKVSDTSGLEGYSDAFSLAIAPTISIKDVPDTLQAKVGENLTLQPGTADASGAVSWGTEGPLPAWADLAPASGKLSGTPDAAGTIDVVLVARDADNGSARKALRIEIAKNIVVEGPKPSYASVGGAGITTDPPKARLAAGAVRWSLASGVMPTWADLDPASGVLSGTPDRPGEAVLSLRATDAEGTTGVSTSFKVASSSGFAVTNPASYAGRVSVAFGTAAPTVTGATLPVTWSSVAPLPAWAKLDKASGSVSGTPTEESKAEGVVLRAVDAKGVQGYTSPFAIAVAPAMTVDDFREIYEVRAGAVLAIQATAKNPIGPVTWTATNLPGWLTLTGASGAIGARAPQPAPSPSTFEDIRLTAKDGQGFVAPGKPFSVKVNPGLGISGLSASYGGRTSYKMADIVPAASNGVGTLSWSVSGLPSGMGFAPGTGTISGTPSESGSFPVTLKVRDAFDGAETTASTTLQIARGLGVTGVDARYVARAGQDYMSKLPGIVGQRGTPTWSVTGGLPSWAGVNGATGAISGRPPAVSSTPNLKLQVEDGTDKVTASSGAFTLDVLDPVGIADLPTSIVARFGFDFATAPPRLLNAVEPVTWSWAPGVTPPAWLSLDAATGSLVGKNPDTLGSQPALRLVGTDSTQASATSVQVALTVYSKPEITVSVQNIRNRVGDTVVITPSVQGIVKTASWAIVPVSGTLPAGLVAKDTDGSVNAAVTGTGNAQFVLRVTDSADGRSFDSGTFSIITYPALKLSGIAPSYRVRADSYLGTDSPRLEGARSLPTYALSIAPPAGLAFDTATGVLSGIPKTQVSLAGVKITVTDPTPGDVRTATATFDLNILGPMSAGGVGTVTVRANSDIGKVSFTPAAANALDPAKVTWSLAAGKLPDGIALDPATGKLTGTAPPTDAPVTTTGLSLLAVDTDLSQAQTGTFSITVNPQLDFTVADQTASEGQPFTYTLVPKGLVGAPTWTATGLPSPLAITQGGTIAHQAMPSPKTGSGSPYTVEVSLQDGVDPIGTPPLKKTFVLTVKGAPILTQSPASIQLATQTLPDERGACSTATVSNTGSVDIADLAWSVVSPNDAYFKATCQPDVSATVPACTAALGAGKSCAVGVSMGGSTPGNFTGTLRFTATGATRKDITLSGETKAAFTNFTFTNCGVSGPFGPTLANCQASYKNTPWTQDTTKLNNNGKGVQVWTVPVSGRYKIEANGAYGGGNRNLWFGPSGSSATSFVTLTAGDKVSVLVGQLPNGYGNTNVRWGNGGGGSFVYQGSTLYAAAGGGGSYGDNSTGGANTLTTAGGDGAMKQGRCGGALSSKGGTDGGGGNGGCGSGGGGWNGAGTAGSQGTQGGTDIRVNSGVGVNGGFGGGGNAQAGGGGGGGGGYSGGGGGGFDGGGYGGGGAGGSFATGTGSAIEVYNSSVPVGASQGFVSYGGWIRITLLP